MSAFPLPVVDQLTQSALNAIATMNRVMLHAETAAPGSPLPPALQQARLAAAKILNLFNKAFSPVKPAPQPKASSAPNSAPRGTRSSAPSLSEIQQLLRSIEHLEPLMTEDAPTPGAPRHQAAPPPVAAPPFIKPINPARPAANLAATAGAHRP